MRKLVKPKDLPPSAAHGFARSALAQHTYRMSDRGEGGEGRGERRLMEILRYDRCTNGLIMIRIVRDMRWVMVGVRSDCAR